MRQQLVCRVTPHRPTTRSQLSGDRLRPPNQLSENRDKRMASRLMKAVWPFGVVLLVVPGCGGGTSRSAGVAPASTESSATTATVAAAVTSTSMSPSTTERATTTSTGALREPPTGEQLASLAVSMAEKFRQPLPEADETCFADGSVVAGDER